MVVVVVAVVMVRLPMTMVEVFHVIQIAVKVSCRDYRSDDIDDLIIINAIGIVVIRIIITIIIIVVVIKGNVLVIVKDRRNKISDSTDDFSIVPNRWSYVIPLRRQNFTCNDVNIACTSRDKQLMKDFLFQARVSEDVVYVISFCLPPVVVSGLSEDLILACMSV